MTLDLLPVRHGGAAENMAVDFLLLQRYPASTHPRFRHYGWHRPAFTFGYSQKIAFVRAQLPAGEHVELCRRATGGGVVDHRDDWTYTLIIPRGHALCDDPAPRSYHLIHLAIAETLRALGQSVILKETSEPLTGDEPPAGTDENAATAPGPTVCFTRPETHDVVRADSGAKVAGAAQKRTKHGLLFQGSIARATLAPDLDWDAFHSLLVEKLSAALNLPAVESPWPEFADGELDGLIEHYTSPEWLELR